MNCETTLVSQLLVTIDGHLKNVSTHMENDEIKELEMSVDDPDDDELWLSGHRSIFSSYGSHCRKAPVLRDSQYEGFHWDLYEDRNYHRLAFEQQDVQPLTCGGATTSFSEWSMRLSSGGIGGEGDTEDDADVEGDDTTSSSDPPRTSWHAIKNQSTHRSCSSSSATTNTSDNNHRSRSPLTLYRLFQRARSQQHPCRLYQNFSDKSLCDSLTSSSSCSNLNKMNEPKKQQQIPMPRIQLQSPTTFSQLKLNKSISHNDLISSIEQSLPARKEQIKPCNRTTTSRQRVDQCLQTSIYHDSTPPSSQQSTRRFVQRPICYPPQTDNRCSQTDNMSVVRSKSADRLANNSTNPSQSSAPHRRSLVNISSLPDLGFLTFYAKENPVPPPPPSTSITTTQSRRSCTAMKSTLSEPSSLMKKATRTVFYCSINAPVTSAMPTRPTSLLPPSSTAGQRPRTLKEIKRIKSVKTSPTMTNSPLRALPLSPAAPPPSTAPVVDETATLSSTCSSSSTSANSTSSSGYFSNSSANHPRSAQTPLSPHPLKSCLKRAKTEDLTSPPFSIGTTTANVLAVGVAGDIFTLAARTLAAGRLGDHSMTTTSRHRRYSAPSFSSYQQHFYVPLRTQQQPGCTLSEHDLRAKKSVSFCDDIARRLITPSASPKHRPTPPPPPPPPAIPPRHDRGYCDLVPRENLTDSPPSEFNLSEDEDDNDENNQQQQPPPMNFIEHAPSEIPKPLPVKYGGDKYLIDAFANTVLHILEIKCGDPQSYYLNNLTNRELDRTLRQDLCLLLREVLEDGLRQHGGSLFSKKLNLWRLIDMTTPTTGRFNEAKVKAQIGLPSATDWTEKFTAFIFHLLNFHELAAWLTYFVSHRAMFTAYYEPWAFVLVYDENDLFERVTNQLEKLSPLPFRLKFILTPLVPPPPTPSNNTSSTPRSTTNQRPSSLLPKRFNVRAWLRDRKTQVKISPREPQAPATAPPPPSSLPKPSSSSAIPPPTKSISSQSVKSPSSVAPPPPPNVSIRRKLGSIPVAKRHQTVH